MTTLRAFIAGLLVGALVTWAALVRDGQEAPAPVRAPYTVITLHDWDGVRRDWDEVQGLQRLEQQQQRLQMYLQPARVP